MTYSRPIPAIAERLDNDGEFRFGRFGELCFVRREQRWSLAARYFVSPRRYLDRLKSTEIFRDPANELTQHCSHLERNIGLAFWELLVLEAVEPQDCKPHYLIGIKTARRLEFRLLNERSGDWKPLFPHADDITSRQIFRGGVGSASVPPFSQVAGGQD